MLCHEYSEGKSRKNIFKWSSLSLPNAIRFMFLFLIIYMLSILEKNITFKIKEGNVKFSMVGKNKNNKISLPIYCKPLS